MDRYFIQCAQVRPSGLLVYGRPDPPYQHKANKEFREAKTYSGNMKRGSIRRIRKTINVFLLKSPTQEILNPVSKKKIRFRLTFATITISDARLIDHKEAYKLGLKPLLRWLRREVGGLYIWKAELQKRGQVHWHITLNRFLHYKDLRDEWNRLQRSAGWLEGYEARTGHTDANSTDIRAVAKIERIDLYLAKYMAKDDPAAVINGKVWGCSQELQKARYYEFEMDWEELDWLKGLEAAKLTKVVQLEHCTVISNNQKGLLVPPRKREEFEAWQREN
jgi:hypothetical protein